VSLPTAHFYIQPLTLCADNGAMLVLIGGRPRNTYTANHAHGTFRCTLIVFAAALGWRHHEHTTCSDPKPTRSQIHHSRHLIATLGVPRSQGTRAAIDGHCCRSLQDAISGRVIPSTLNWYITGSATLRILRQSSELADNLCRLVTTTLVPELQES